MAQKRKLIIGGSLIMKNNIGRLTSARQSKVGQMELVKQSEFAGNEVDLYKGVDGEVYMTAKQLGEALEYKEPVIAINKIIGRNEYLQNDEFSVVVKLVSTDGKRYDTRLLTEDGIYEVTMLSRQPKAQEFRFFIRELLKGLRKGELKVVQHSYQIEDPIERAKQWIKEEERRQQLQLENEKMKPLATYAESIAEAGEEILIGELAKILKQNGYDTGQNRLFKQLREEGYLQSRHGDMHNVPTQRAMEMGLFRIVKRLVYSGSESKVRRTTKVTPKGQIYFINRYCGGNDE